MPTACPINAFFLYCHTLKLHLHDPRPLRSFVGEADRYYELLSDEQKAKWREAAKALRKTDEGLAFRGADKELKRLPPQDPKTDVKLLLKREKYLKLLLKKVEHLPL